MHLVHAVLGMLTELGELADPIKKHLIYGKPLDTENYLEEDGDLRWYMALGESAINAPHEDVIKYNNLQKLRKRYPATYSDADALARADKV